MQTEIITREESTELVDAELFSPVSIFDIERFEQVMRVASVMARNTTLPDHLKSKANDHAVAYEETRGNCFMICNLAATWGMDPFAVAQATSFLYGKLVLEGKLVRAVIDKKLGFSLHYAFFGQEGDMKRRCYVSDKPLVDANGSLLTEDQIKEAKDNPSSGFRITVGTLQKWHTKNKSGGINDNWAKDENKMFRERGAREWCREFKPGLMLGVYTNDEFDEMEYTARSNRAKDITYNPLLESNSSAPMETIEIKEPIKTDSSIAAASAAGEGSAASVTGTASAETSAPVSSPEGPSTSGEKAAERETPSRSAASEHTMTADQLVQCARYLARQDTQEKLDKAAATIKAGSKELPVPSHADLVLLAKFKSKIADIIQSGEGSAGDEIDAFVAHVEEVFGLNDFPGDR